MPPSAAPEPQQPQPGADPQPLRELLDQLASGPAWLAECEQEARAAATAASDAAPSSLAAGADASSIAVATAAAVATQQQQQQEAEDPQALLGEVVQRLSRRLAGAVEAALRLRAGLQEAPPLEAGVEEGADVQPEAAAAGAGGSSQALDTLAADGSEPEEGASTPPWHASASPASEAEADAGGNVNDDRSSAGTAAAAADVGRPPPPPPPPPPPLPPQALIGCCSVVAAAERSIGKARAAALRDPAAAAAAATAANPPDSFDQGDPWGGGGDPYQGQAAEGEGEGEGEGRTSTRARGRGRGQRRQRAYAAAAAAAAAVDDRVLCCWYAQAALVAQPAEACAGVGAGRLDLDTRDGPAQGGGGGGGNGAGPAAAGGARAAALCVVVDGVPSCLPEAGVKGLRRAAWADYGLRLVGLRCDDGGQGSLSYGHMAAAASERVPPWALSHVVLTLFVDPRPLQDLQSRLALCGDYRLLPRRLGALSAAVATQLLTAAVSGALADAKERLAAVAAACAPGAFDPGSFLRGRREVRLGVAAPAVAGALVSIVRRAYNPNLEPFACRLLDCTAEGLERALHGKLLSNAVRQLDEMAEAADRARRLKRGRASPDDAPGSGGGGAAGGEGTAVEFRSGEGEVLVLGGAVEGPEGGWDGGEGGEGGGGWGPGGEDGEGQGDGSEAGAGVWAADEAQAGWEGYEGEAEEGGWGGGEGGAIEGEDGGNWEEEIAAEAEAVAVGVGTAGTQPPASQEPCHEEEGGWGWGSGGQQGHWGEEEEAEEEVEEEEVEVATAAPPPSVAPAAPAMAPRHPARPRAAAAAAAHAVAAAGAFLGVRPLRTVVHEEEGEGEEDGAEGGGGRDDWAF
ncbi:hypothetical protein HYH03_001576 [Edaphochlamys debaryana]|uniref:Uncharacterized protein n=1 Tax=Edaphochlamys debaryana TaxID=47281 RepID=A0A836C6D6_9CHLO|nr:hypothetical protein HYH03_001576 [Edaphochlamys debaryana]|eukprot:KAG2500814.1 hypothetical protein HYH03_001576 [Edaphochlamys debaryana]